MKKPNLFLVGEQKAGTTTLHQLLSAHPEVFMTPLKEPGFFCTDFHEEADSFHQRRMFYNYRSFIDYMPLFSEWNNETYGGESSSTYFYSSVAAKNIVSFNPHAKAIVLLRDPLTYLPSLHAQYLKEQKEDIVDLDKALDAESYRRKGLSIPPKMSAPSLLFYSERIKYGLHLERMYLHFRKEAVHVEFFEDMFINMAASFQRIVSFLGLHSDMTLPDIKANPRTSRRFGLLYNIINNPRLKWLVLHSFPLPLQLSIKKTLDAIFLRPAERAAISAELRSRMIEMSLPEVRRLESILKRPSPWGWAHEH